MVFYYLKQQHKRTLFLSFYWSPSESIFKLGKTRMFYGQCKGKYTYCYLPLKALLAKTSLDCNVLGLHFS